MTISILDQIAASIGATTTAIPPKATRSSTRTNKLDTARTNFIASLEKQIAGVDILLSGEEWYASDKDGKIKIDKNGKKRLAQKWFTKDVETGDYSVTVKYGRTNFDEIASTDSNGLKMFVSAKTLEDVKTVYQMLVDKTTADELDAQLQARVTAISEEMRKSRAKAKAKAEAEAEETQPVK